MPRDYRLTAGDRAVVHTMIDILFPVRDRSDGIVFDAYVGNPDVNSYRLEDIAVPTLLVHARDDTMASYQGAQAAAQRIPRAELVSHERGGHLMLGQAAATQTALLDFFGSCAEGPSELR